MPNKSPYQYLATVEAITKQLQKGMKQFAELSKDAQTQVAKISQKLAEQHSQQILINQQAGLYIDPLKTQIEYEEKQLAFYKEGAQMLLDKEKIEKRRLELTEEQEKVDKKTRKVAKDHNLDSLDNLDQIQEKMSVMNGLAAEGSSASIERVLREQKEVRARKEAFEELLEMDEEEAAGAHKVAQQRIKSRGLQLELQTKIGAKLGMVGRFQESQLGRFAIMSKEVGGLTGQFHALGRSLKETFNYGNVASGVLEKIVESTKLVAVATDEAITSVNRATGQSGLYDDILIDVGTHYREFDIGTQKASQSLIDLHNNMAGFSELSDVAQTKLVLLTSKLDALGVGGATSAEIFQALDKNLGMSTDGITKTTKDLTAAAFELKVAPATMLDGFSKALPVLSVYGKKAVGIYKNLAAAAKASGIEVGNLLSSMSQYDTFEAAANAAGNLNAILGGDIVNSVELLNASEDQRVRILRQSLDLAGKSWVSMGKFERQAVASAAGMSDLAEAGKLFSMNMDGFEKMTEDAKEAAHSEEKFNEAIKSTIALKNKLTNMIMSFGFVLHPVVVTLGAFFDMITIIMENPFGKVIVGATAAFLGLVAVLRTAGMVTNGFLAIKTMLMKAQVAGLWGTIKNIFWNKKETASIGELAKAERMKRLEQIKSRKSTDGLSASTKTMGKAAAVSWRSILALGAAFMMVGVGVAAAAAGISLLMTSISTGTQVGGLLVFLIGMTALLFVFAKAALVASPGAIALGFGFLMLGGGLALAGLGLSLVADKIGMVSAALLGMIFAVPAITLLSVSIFALATAMAALGVGMWLLNTDKLSAAGELFNGLARTLESMPTNLGVTFDAVADSIPKSVDMAANVNSVATMIEAVADLDTTVLDKMLRLNMSLVAAPVERSALATIASTSMVEVKNLTNLVNEANRYTEIQAKMKSPDEDSLVRLLSAAAKTGSNTSAASGKVGPLEVTLIVDKREFGKAVTDVFEKRVT